MRQLFTTLALTLSFLSTACGGPPSNSHAPELLVTPSALASAPALDQDFPDPAVVKAQDGWYYSYATQTVTENEPKYIINIQAAKSKDLKTWAFIGEVFPVKPRWAHSTQNFWAPDVSFHEGLYYMYFSAMPDSEDGFCIGVATSSKPQGPFQDSGRPVVCGPGFTTIDPMAFDDPQTGEKYLYWGSGFGPIQVQPLSADRKTLQPGSKPRALLYPVQSQDPTEYRRLLEGAWVHYREGYYYLFFSGDNCCSPPHYAVMVARSRSPVGPYEFPTENWRDSIVIQADENYIGPGHNSVIDDDQGRTWTLYHAVDRQHPEGTAKIPGDREVRRVLLVQEMEWIEGWPRLKPNSNQNGASKIQRKVAVEEKSVSIGAGSMKSHRLPKKDKRLTTARWQ